jgi:leucyl/phenylalanyl-tRNA--protein transferase
MLRSGAAKVAVACLVRRVADSGGIAVDVQHDCGHAKLIGAQPVPRAEYLALLAEHADGGDALVTDPLPARRLAEPAVLEGVAA